jgi:hypothetical protein
MTLPPTISGVDFIETEPAAETPHVHSVLFVLGTSEGVAPECATSYRYIGQDAVVGYKAEAVEVSDNVTMKTNAKVMYVAFFTVVNLLI